MSTGSRIQWTDATWNPTVGCKIVSPGCANCYAMKLAARLARMGGKGGAKYAGLTVPSKAGPVWNGTIRLAEDALDQPLRWRKPRRIFVNSMSDLFADELTDEQIDDVLVIGGLASWHVLQILTKRAARMRRYMATAGERILAPLERLRLQGGIAPRAIHDAVGRHGHSKPFIWPLPNVWLGVSVEDQARADERIPLLLDTPAAVRFISAEPLLGPVDLRDVCNTGDAAYDALECCPDEDAINGIGYPALDWVICGGESGPRARPMHPEWARSLRDQCRAMRVPFFFKQWGEWAPAELAPDEGDPFFAVTPDGRQIRKEHARGDEHLICRVGTKRAGRLLDGIEHNEFPRAREAVEAML